MWCARVLYLVLGVLLVLCANINGKRFDTRCKLVRELMKVGIPNDLFLGQWVCLIEKVSNRDTKAYVVTPSGKKYYGLYQIPSRWCREGKKGGECNVACEALLDDDIRDDTACAVNIFHREGFKYWTTWTARCKNDDLITKEIYKVRGSSKTCSVTCSVRGNTFGRGRECPFFTCPDLNSPRSSPERSLSYTSNTLRARRRLARNGLGKSNRLDHFGIH